MKRNNLNIKSVLFTQDELDKSINRIVHEIIEKSDDIKKVAIVGIRSRGVYLAERIVKKINELEKINVPFGTLDITLYRDDFFKSLSAPEVGGSNFSFNPEQYRIILVDDVLYTGRTIRAAIDAILDYGRPLSIQLAVMIDRGGRELPIQPDYCGKVITLGKNEAVAVMFKEADNEDKVVIIEKQK